MVETASGWRDEAPDLTSGEHDVLTAMLELAWHDVQIDLDSVPLARREEALAAKVTAYEWVTADDLCLTSFRSVCLHVGLVDVVRARKVVLRDKRTPEPGMSFLREVEVPDEPVPSKWLEEFASTTREDRAYIKQPRPRRPRPALPAPSSAPPCDCPNPPCAALDDGPQPPFTLEALIADVNVSGPAAADESATVAGWVAAAAEPEDCEEDG